VYFDEPSDNSLPSSIAESGIVAEVLDKTKSTRRMTSLWPDLPTAVTNDAEFVNLVFGRIKGNECRSHH
jgi:hypothetical protein